MTADIPEFELTVDDRGHVRFAHPAQAHAYLRGKFAGQVIVGQFYPHREKRSDRQNHDAVVLDPFGGSGTSGCAALAEGRRAIILERDPDYAEIARQRCEAAEAGTDWKAPPQQRQMFEVAS